MSFFRKILYLLIISGITVACTEPGKPIKKQVAAEEKRLANHSLIRTAKPGVHLESLLHQGGISKNTLVILDLDDTVMTSPEGLWLGRSEMFYDLVGKELQESRTKTKKEVGEYVDPLLIEVYKRIPVVLTDERLPEVIAAYKQRGATVIGMTSRGHAVWDTTLEQLARIGVHFSDVGAKSDYVPINGGRHVIFKFGLVMVSHGNTKGEALEALIQSNCLPSDLERVIMIDDKQSHLNSVGNFVQKMEGDNVVFSPALCTYPQSVKPYNSSEAIEQLEVFLAQWQKDPVIAHLMKQDPFTQKFVKEHGIKVSHNPADNNER